MKTNSIIRFGIAALTITGIIVGCSADPDGNKPQSSVLSDRELIEVVLDETASRWRLGDKAVLYDMEFSYFKEEFTYDEYLEMKQIKRLKGDTLETFRVNDIEFYEQDSAKVEVDVVFVGPSGDTSHLDNTWMMFFHEGHWIRPSISNVAFELKRIEERRVADSMAALESDEGW